MGSARPNLAACSSSRFRSAPSPPGTTPGRIATSNDQCFVEQTNGSIVRQLVGYDRSAGEPAYQQLAELYCAVRLSVNVFQPSLKLRTKRREGSRVRRTYDIARTPFQRVVASGVLDHPTQDRLDAIAAALDPVRLLRQIQTLHGAIWRHAILPPSAMAAQPPPANAVPSMCRPTVSVAAEAEQPGRRPAAGIGQPAHGDALDVEGAVEGAAREFNERSGEGGIR
jgi:hypothetical protein